MSIDVAICKISGRPSKEFISPNLLSSSKTKEEEEKKKTARIQPSNWKKMYYV